MTLMHQTNLIRVQLGYPAELPLAQVVERAEVDLGLSEQARGLKLVERVGLCLQTLGVEASPADMASVQPEMPLVVGVIVTPQASESAYRLEAQHMTWAQHDQRARSQGCTLAPVTGREEWEAVMRAAAGQTVWIGAVRHGSGNGPGANHWHWSSGESWAYTKWCRGEPNNYEGREDRVQMYGRRELRPPWGMHAHDGEWNDIHGGWRGPAVYKVGAGTWTPAQPQPQAMAREGAGAALISAHELQGCWVGCALLMPWSGSLRAVDEDTYVRDWQMCLVLPLCGREYRRTPGTNTFHWHENGNHKGNEDYEVFHNRRCACMAPGEPPGGGSVGVRLCSWGGSGEPVCL